MNKKVLTLCAGFLLAGGLTSSVLAETMKQAATNETQYYYVRVNSDQSGTVTSSNDVLDVNGTVSDPLDRATKEQNRSTWWRVVTVTETVNNTTKIIGYQLVNALTGKPLSVTTDEGEVYDTFTGDDTWLQFVVGNEQWNNSGNKYDYFYYYGKDDAVGEEGDGNAWKYSLEAVPTQNLTAEQINKVNNGYFGFQFGYLNEDGEYAKYESLEGVTPFAGDLVAYGKDAKEIAVFDGLTTPTADTEFMIFNKTADKYVVLLKEKWSQSNTNHDPKEDGNGHKYALMTAKEIIEDQSQAKESDKKIASYIFSVNMPVVKDFSPMEVVANDAILNKNGDKGDVEMYIANMGGYDYLTTTIAGVDPDKNTANEVAVDVTHTIVSFGSTDYVDFSQFYGYAITIKGVSGEGIEGMTIRPDVPTETNIQPSEAWVRADYVAFTRPEAQWIVTSINGAIYLTNRETKASIRWDEAFDMLGTYTLALRHESGDTYVANVGDKAYKFEIKKVAELGGTSFEDYGNYQKDQSEIGMGKSYRVAFTSGVSGEVSYIGETAKGEVILTTNEDEAINFDLQKTFTTDTLKNNGAIDENVVADVFHIVNNYMGYNTKTKEWEYVENGDTLAFYRYTLVNGDRALKYNDNKDVFELVTPNAANFVYADNFVVKKKDGENTLNIIKVTNADFDNDNLKLDKDGKEVIAALNGQAQFNGEQLFVGYDATTTKDEDDVTIEAGKMMYFDFNNADPQIQTNMYNWNSNAQLSIPVNTFDSYRRFAAPDTLEFYRIEYSDEFFYENGKFLGMTYNRDMYNPAIYVDTAYVRNDTKKPTYLLAVDPTIEPSHQYCPIHGIDPTDCPADHQTTIPGYTNARYLVSYTDSVVDNADLLQNPFLHENQYTKLGFVPASHRVDSLYILDAAGDTINHYTLTDAAAKTVLNPVEFAFRIVNPTTQDFVIETTEHVAVKSGDYTPAYIQWVNGCPVLTQDITLAEVFNVRDAEGEPTANEEISAEAGAVSVVATDGAIIVKGAEGKNVVVATILGKVVANEVATSDNETIAVPAGIAVVAVDGESFKVVVK